MTGPARRPTAVAIVAPACLLVLLVAAPRADAHAAFVGSIPAPGARVPRAPERIVLTFTEPLNERLSRATVVATSTGRAIAAPVETSSRRIVVRPRAPLPTGAYSVRWHTVSTDDGHALEGTFSFGVRAAAVGGAHDVEQSPLARTGWLRIVLRALLYVTLLLAGAALIVPVLLGARRSSWLAPGALDGSGLDTRAVMRRERVLQVDLLWLATAAAVASTLAEAADAAGGLSAAGVRDFVLGSVAGVGRVAAVVALAAGALTPRRHARLAALAVVVAMSAVALSGHAASAEPRAPAIVDDLLHLLAGAIWLGGIGILALAWGPSLRRMTSAQRRVIARHVLPAFGRIALPAFTVVVATGMLSLLFQLRSLGDLVTTGYGNVLLVKMALVAVVAMLSFAHALRLRPRLLRDTADPRAERRHWRLMRAEPIVGLLILGAVGTLVAFPLPPRQLGEADEARAATSPCDPCPLPTPKESELSVAGNAGSRLVAAWIRRRAGRLTGTVRVLDIHGKPASVPVDVVGASTASCGPGCRRLTMTASDRLRVAVAEDGRRWVAVLPARWRPAGTQTARRLLRRAQDTMRHLRSVRQHEVVRSVPGHPARTDYRLVAPDRLAFRTGTGVKTVIIGARQWFRARDLPWTSAAYGSGLPFSTRSWFRWTAYARSVRLLGRRHGSAVIALADPATPVWYRLVIDERTGRVLRERMSANGHFGSTRYYDFNRPMEVRRPDA